MTVEQIYTGCLAQGAYYIASNGEAVIIDPLREVGPYLDRAEKDGVTIKYILETHFHADFVSGHIDLAAKTGAKIVYGPTANTAFDCHIAQDGEVLKVGDVTIHVLHTPGHTMESTTYLLKDESGKDHAIFSGDTLFLGDVGRPDLAQKAATMTQEDLAGILFDSLRNKIMVLGDDVIVYPGHGAGSSCGKNMSKETVGTIGEQKATNYALRANMTKEEFVAEVTDGLLPPPAYFPENVRLNKTGYESLDKVMERGLRPLSVDAFEVAANETDALILDTRHQNTFIHGFIPQSIFIGIQGSFAMWVGALIPDIKQEILVVADPGMEEEVVTRLSRVGYDNCIGFLDGGFDAWKNSGKEVDALSQVTAEELKGIEGATVVDVRKSGEYLSEHLIDAIHVELDYINDQMASVPQEGTFYVHCAGGYRSVIASSILKARGYHNMVDVAGGFKAIKEAGLKVSDYVCPTTL
ncbi:MAG TPA: MBL fold metallo-hydrolase [Flavobacteriales bacterium]|jgi:glyoxylase-like metal-dependent hydrolase (beta-lactamase superfamily II)/rhodanese-related sulfurtransferase|nr:MBL fold metallo-hydrolase [Cryomorphaceae bacterium]MBT7659176.1 MBL fold metallo-hydrolase [Bacteroidota bacterium]MDA7722579.1 rhodanese-like domain-containing protein [Schleiferiaceae bacterium]MDB4346808.1 rhodanese-like domain-containing protein [bacterium]HAP68708.1 MBL fold metallo-hydrolase [Flavobacteriales bacterium]